jgi:uncharacterized protein (TIGR03083 family)
MAAAVAYLDRVQPALERAGDRFRDRAVAALYPNAKITGSEEWTIRDTTAHVASVIARYADGVEGGGTWAERPAELADINQRSIEALEGVSMDELGAMIVRDLANLVARVRSYGDDPPSFRFHGGEEVRADTGLGILLGELLVHGWDIARTTGRPWPIDPADVELVVEGVERVLPGWVDPERARRLTATYALRLRGQGTTHLWSFRDGRLQVGQDGRRPDVTISAHPAALLLVLYKRRPQWRAIARGRMLAWGRRPWLAFSLGGRFHQP